MKKNLRRLSVALCLLALAGCASPTAAAEVSAAEVSGAGGFTESNSLPRELLLEAAETGAFPWMGVFTSTSHSP